MVYSYTNLNRDAKIFLIKDEKEYQQKFFQYDDAKAYYTLAWNKGKSQKLSIDGVELIFEENVILPLMQNQSFVFENAQDVLIWKFNRDFYCVLNHDAQVSCIGFIFYGPSPTMFVELDETSSLKMKDLASSFIEEFQSDEDVKEEMLRMLLVKLIIYVTRLAKKKYYGTLTISDIRFEMVRKFNVLVEQHFRKEHLVQFYADALHLSPKTVANYFSLYSEKTPLQIINERIIREAKRLLLYTDKTTKEIADELGFEDTAYFSKVFKKNTQCSPSEFKTKGKILENRSLNKF